MSSAQEDSPPVHPILMPMALAPRHRSAPTRCPGASCNWRTGPKPMRKPLPKVQSLRDSRASQSLKPAVDGINSSVEMALWVLPAQQQAQDKGQSIPWTHHRMEPFLFAPTLPQVLLSWRDLCVPKCPGGSLTSCAHGRGNPGSESRAAAPDGRCGMPGTRMTRPGDR